MRIIFLMIIGWLLAGCAGKTPLPFDRNDYSVNPITAINDYQTRQVNVLVLHYTALDDQQSLKVLTGNKVSIHYLVPTLPLLKSNKPEILQIVPEDNPAWHAGISYWRGEKNLNKNSIGIEIVNRGFTTNKNGEFWYPYNPAQIDLIIRTVRDITQRYHIPPENIVAHSDIAPLRKSDPGPLFPWVELAQAGLGAWPDPDVVDRYLANRPPQQPADVTRLQNMLARYGYAISQTGVLDAETRKVIRAFQMHFRPENISGMPDAQTEAIAMALVAKYQS